MDLTPFKNLVKGECGLCFEDIREATLRDGICARMAATGTKSHAKYLTCLLSDHNELNSLVNLLTVNETYFFREAAHLQMLSDRIVPELLGRKNTGEKIKIVSAGCSTGEEPYSIAMALMEKYGAGIRSSLSIIGVDIDSDAIGKAGEGVFSGHSFRGFPDELRAKYFAADGPNRFKIKDALKEGVSFRRLNLLSDEYSEALRGVDVVFYRNVSIYFEPETQKRIFAKLAGCLNERGYLFVSATETLSHNIGTLSLIELDGLFLYQKKIEFSVDERRAGAAKNAGAKDRRYKLPGFPIPPHASGPAARPGTPPAKRAQGGAAALQDPKDTLAERRSDTRSAFQEALLLARDKRYEDALSRIEELLRRDPVFVKAHMLKAGILINMKRMDEAERVCLESIETDQWCLEGYLLLGLIAKIRNDEEAAIKRFKESLYIQSSCWLAHFYLAELYRLRGELERARCKYEVVVKLLGKGDLHEHGLTFFPLSFPAEHIVHLCNHNLSELKKRLA